MIVFSLIVHFITNFSIAFAQHFLDPEWNKNKWFIIKIKVFRNHDE